MPDIIAWVFATSFVVLVLMVAGLMIRLLINSFKHDWKFTLLCVFVGIVLFGGLWSWFYLTGK